MSGGVTSLAPPPALIRVVTDSWTEPFWQAMAEKRFVAPRCGSCGTFRLPATPFCPDCLSQGMELVDLSGRATLYSYTVMRRAFLPEMEGHIPYVPGLVVPEEAPGIRFASAIVGAPVDDIRIGAALSLTWGESAFGIPVPLFELA